MFAVVQDVVFIYVENVNVKVVIIWIYAVVSMRTFVAPVYLKTVGIALKQALNVVIA